MNLDAVSVRFPIAHASKEFEAAGFWSTDER